MSATLTTSLGDLAITGDSYLRLAQRGNWVAILEVVSKEAPAIGEPATLAIVGEAKPNEPKPVPALFAGTVRHARLIPGSESLVVRVVGGAGRLFSTIAPLPDIVGATTAVPVGLVLAAIVAAAGEKLTPGVETALDAYLLPRWHVAGGTSARDAIDLLVWDVASSVGVDLEWRVLADGTIWAGVEMWPEAPGAWVYTDQDPDDGVMRFAPSGAPLLPGQSVLGEHAIEVTYSLSSPAVRASVRHSIPGDPPRVPAIEVRSMYLDSYAATLVVQRADGTLDLQCDDTRIGQLLAVPYRVGLPGCAATLPPASRVRVRFENGSPRGAYACDVDQDATATHALALVGDGCGYLTGTAPPGGGPVVFTWTPIATGLPGEAGLSVVGPGHKYAKGVSS